MKIWAMIWVDESGEPRTVLARAETPWQAKRFLAQEFIDPSPKATVFELKNSGDPGLLRFEDYHDKHQAKRKRKEANASGT